MKVHITSTPEYPKESIESVTSVLAEVPGEIEFQSGEPLSINQIKLRFPEFVSTEECEKLSFKDFFLMADLYRAIYSIPDDEFIVLITGIQNDKEWFSSNSGCHIFVTSNGWEYITKKDAKYGIAYQIVENIFQSVSGIDVSDVMSDPNIHHKSIGCINDMCWDETEVMLKLRTAYICPSCEARATANGVDSYLFLHILKLIDNIRNGLMNYDSIIAELEPQPVYVDGKGKITLGNKTIELNPLQSALYIFFLKQSDGIGTSSMYEYEDHLYLIYKEIRRSGEFSTIHKLCLPYSDDESTFLKNKSELNKVLIKKIGKQESEFYVIDNVETDGYNIYKIKLDFDYRNIDPRF